MYCAVTLSRPLQAEEEAAAAKAKAEAEAEAAAAKEVPPLHPVTVHTTHISPTRQAEEAAAAKAKAAVSPLLPASYFARAHHR